MPMPNVLAPIREFLKLESAGGILLLGAAVLALVCANTPLAAYYGELIRVPAEIRIGPFEIAKPLLLWINDGLMAVFFFVVGLEMKREVVLGELATPARAVLSVIAALGGMIVPAAIYAALNAGGPGAAGWGIPMATDIAFALGVLALLGTRVPTSLKVFVTGVAIVDDLGAVLVIAVFYTAELVWPALAAAGLALLLLVVVNRAGIRSVTVYVLLGLALWLALLQSGVHAAIAGLLTALAVPARRVIDGAEFLRRVRRYTAEFAEHLALGPGEPAEDQRDAIRSLKAAVREVDAPLPRLENALHPWVAYVIMPVFALANAGVGLGGDLEAAFATPVTAGIVLGLFVGKQVGILGFSWLAVRGGVATLPEGAGWWQIWGVALLCGMGFTMSLFIAGLAFPGSALRDTAKLGILAASMLSGAAGLWVLGRVRKPSRSSPLSPA